MTSSALTSTLGDPVCAHCSCTRDNHGDRDACVRAGYYSNRFEPDSSDMTSDEFRHTVDAAGALDALDDELLAFASGAANPVSAARRGSDA